MKNNGRTRSNLQAEWRPKIRVCAARKAEENDHCCASFVFTSLVQFDILTHVSRVVRYYRRKLVDHTTFETCSQDPDTYRVT